MWGEEPCPEGRAEECVITEIQTSSLGQSLSPCRLEGMPAEPQEDNKSDDICANKGEHYPFLDMTRICCVALAAIDHGAEEFATWNRLCAQNWVAQYLFLVCGVCYGMSKKSLFQYEIRLVAYFLMGVCLHWITWLLKGLDWRSKFFAMVYQFWFVFGLILMTWAIAPLRAYLDRTRSRCDEEEARRGSSMTVADLAVNRGSLLKSLGVIGGGMLGLMILGNFVMVPFLTLLAPSFLELVQRLGAEGTYGLPHDGHEATKFFARLSFNATVTATNVYLILACPRVFKNRRLTAWFVFFNTYLYSLFWFRGGDVKPFHSFDLLMLGLTTYYLGLLHRGTFGKYLARYWFVVMLCCTLLTPNGLHERLDARPPRDLSLRIRFTLTEVILVLTWLCAGERLVSTEIFTEDRMEFMNEWALIVFLVNNAVHMLLPAPLNWAVIIGIIPLCYLRRRARS